MLLDKDYYYIKMNMIIRYYYTLCKSCNAIYGIHYSYYSYLSYNRRYFSSKPFYNNGISVFTVFVWYINVLSSMEFFEKMSMSRIIQSFNDLLLLFKSQSKLTNEIGLQVINQHFEQLALGFSVPLSSLSDRSYRDRLYYFNKKLLNHNYDFKSYSEFVELNSNIINGNNNIKNERVIDVPTIITGTSLHARYGQLEIRINQVDNFFTADISKGKIKESVYGVYTDSWNRWVWSDDLKLADQYRDLSIWIQEVIKSILLV